MPTSLLKKITVFFILGFLTVSAFLIRLDNFKRSELRSIDEIVYFRLGLQLKNDFPSYHIIEYGHELKAQGRDLPDYFSKPLFKYPPGYAGMIAISMKLLKDNLLGAAYVSLIFGSLLIPLIYLMGQLTFGRTVGIVAAFLIYMDPVSIICSQKIWPDIPLAFFMTLTVYLFMLASKKTSMLLYFLSGISSSISVYIKYPGILTVPIMLCIIFINKENLEWRSRKFLISLILPFLSLIPWGIWNWITYKHSLSFLSPELHASPGHIEKLFLILSGLALAVFILSKKKDALFKHWKSSDSAKSSPPSHLNALDATKIIIFIALLYQIMPSLLKSLSFQEMPLTSWAWGVITDGKPTFYIGRLIEFSFLYFFAIAGIIFSPTENKNKTILSFSALIILIFYMLWGNYQCRYVTALIPFLLILCAFELKKIIKAVYAIESAWLRIPLLAMISLIITYSISKTWIINLLISFPNDLCYF